MDRSELMQSYILGAKGRNLNSIDYGLLAILLVCSIIFGHRRQVNSFDHNLQVQPKITPLDISDIDPDPVRVRDVVTTRNLP